METAQKRAQRDRLGGNCERRLRIRGNREMGWQASKPPHAHHSTLARPVTHDRMVFEPKNVNVTWR
eukprot:3557854-Rhodomonas_salina.1